MPCNMLVNLNKLCIARNTSEDELQNIDPVALSALWVQNQLVSCSEKKATLSRKWTFGMSIHPIEMLAPPLAALL